MSRAKRKKQTKGKPRKRMTKRTVELMLERQADEIIAAYQAGHELEQLSEQFIAGPSVIKRLLIKHNIPIRIKPRPRPRLEQLRDEIAAIIAAYQRGVPVSTIAKHHKTSPKLIRQLLQEYQVPHYVKPPVMTVKPPTKRQRAEAKAPLILARYAATQDLEQISKEFDLSQSMILRVLRENKVPIRPRPRPQYVRAQDHPHFVRTEQAIADIIAAYQRGVAVSTIARHHKTVNALIRQILQEHQIPPYVKPEPVILPPTAEEQTILEAYQRNEQPLRVLHQTYALTPYKLYKLLNRYQVERRKKRKPSAESPQEEDRPKSAD